jgi:hypothetical protein
MKRIILSVIVMSFAVAAQAGDATSCQDKSMDKPACCSSKTKVSISNEAKGSCPFAKSECCKEASAKQTAAKPAVLQSPKAAAEASK